MRVRKVNVIERMLREEIEHYREFLDQKRSVSLYKQKMFDILPKLEELRFRLNTSMSTAIPDSSSALDNAIIEQKNFEKTFRELRREIISVSDLFWVPPNPTPTHRFKYIRLNNAILNNFSFLSMVHSKRIEVTKWLINGTTKISESVIHYNLRLSSFDKMPTEPVQLRRLYEQMLHINLDAKQSHNFVQNLNERMNSSSWRFAFSTVEVRDIERNILQVNNRWGIVHTQMRRCLRYFNKVFQLNADYRNGFTSVMTWLDRVVKIIDGLHNSVDPEQHKHQLEVFAEEFANLNGLKELFDVVKEQGKWFIYEADSFSVMVRIYTDVYELPRPIKRGQNGAEVVREELKMLSRRFFQLDALVNVRPHTVRVLRQNWELENKRLDHIRDSEIGRLRN